MKYERGRSGWFHLKRCGSIEIEHSRVRTMAIEDLCKLHTQTAKLRVEKMMLRCYLPQYNFLAKYKVTRTSPTTRFAKPAFLTPTA
jgi:hypothetical protein